jgi:ubiquinone/menaquinone biosynthesis C-methylase UbiE
VLEVAPGPGYFAIELAKLGSYPITGLDVSRTMVDIAKENARKAGVAVDFQLGNASAMPFADERFDFIYCSAAFKNFSEPVTVLDEMHRVLKPDGEAVIADLRKDASLEEIDRFVKESGRGRVDAWLTKMTFRHLLLKRAYTRSDFAQMAGKSRFGGCIVHPVSLGFEVRFTKAKVANTGASMGAWLNNPCDV